MQKETPLKEVLTAPRGVQCSICGRMFGKKSIKIHEPQCIKKWELENEHLPVDKRQAFPPRFVAPEIGNHNPYKPKPTETSEKLETPTSGRSKPPGFPCYLCGRLFSVSSIYIHEPQCLKQWKIENNKLPLHKQKPVPIKPDIKFTASGGVDFVKTFNSIWNNHLDQLVECKKCGRTFFPDRIEKHENVCNGTRVNIAKKKEQ